MERETRGSRKQQQVKVVAKRIEVAGGTMEGKIGNIRRTTFGEASILDQTAAFAVDSMVVVEGIYERG